MKIVVADSSQIEARQLAWLASHNALLDLFRQGDEALARGDKSFDVYSVIGSELFGFKMTKKEFPLERQVSKNLSLGLGYSMGWFKLAMEMAKGMLGADPITFDASWVERFGVDVGKFANNPCFVDRDRR